LVARLGDGTAAACDPSLAQRTLGYDFTAAAFTDELAGICGIDRSSWPAVSPSAGARGRLRLGRSHVPLRALLGDVGAATRAVLGDVSRADDGALVLGTGGFVVVPTGRTPRQVDGLLTSLLYEDGDGPVFAIEGTVHGLASAIVEAGRRGGWEALPPERIAARSGPASRFPRVEAAIEGTGTPDWKPASPFAVEAGEYGPEEVVRGTLEALVLRFGRIAELLRASGSCPARFVATGGLAYSPHLTSRLSEVMATPVEVDPGPHRTAVGAALLARDGR
jgi:glycerol kinase